MTREFNSDILHLIANIDYFSDVELGRFMRKILMREIKKAKEREHNSLIKK